MGSAALITALLALATPDMQNECALSDVQNQISTIKAILAEHNSSMNMTVASLLN